MIAKIAVSGVVFSIDKAYSYQIPAGLCLFPGQRVMIPFGKGNRRVEGMVLSVEEGDGQSLKPVDKVLDEAPLLNGTMLRLAAFMHNRYFCTFYDAVKTMLPAGLWFEVRDTYTLLQDIALCRETAKRKPDAVRLAEEIYELGGSAEYAKLRKGFPDEETLQENLRYLIGKRLLSSQTDLLKKGGEKTESIVTLSGEAETVLELARQRSKKAPMQAEVLRLMCSVGSASAKEVLYFTGASMQTLRALEKQGLLILNQREVSRRVEPDGILPAEELTLTPAQKAVFEGLCQTLTAREKKPALLYGVTGSGKTSVYIKLIEACLQEGKSAMLLVPEIALTPQLMGLMTAYFGRDVAILHSGLRVGERYDEWKRIQRGQARLVLGTRSAVFAPAQDLGLVILDEEQEHTYKSENSPRYHARDIALWRGARENALVLLGSATPSVESMYHGKNGEYTLYTLADRYNGKALPPAVLCDMRQELKSGSTGSVSRKLLGRLEECVAAGRQSILFLNRRGNSRMLLCVDCGQAPQCPRCSVSLTYHSANHRLMCHYCGHSELVTDICPDCGGHLKPVGTGTQKVEEELKAKLPDAKVLRMDADTVNAVNDHSTVLKKFKEENIPVLLGTQMVAKGLDFENVTLVGVLDADLSLYVENFRAAETTFSMITQVVGRAGRGKTQGQALIQTMTPEHKVIRLAAQQDYDAFYDMEIALRESRSLPPFADLLIVHFSGMSEQQVASCAVLFRRWLEESLRYPDYRDLTATVLGPAPAPVLKMNNRYYYRLTVSGAGGQKLRTLVAHLLREFAKEKKNRGVSAFADANPYE